MKYYLRCTGTIGEKFPVNKIRNTIPNLVQQYKIYTKQTNLDKSSHGNNYHRHEAKACNESECKIGSASIKIYGIAKGSGMIYPNMATSSWFCFY